MEGNLVNVVKAWDHTVTWDLGPRSNLGQRGPRVGGVNCDDGNDGSLRWKLCLQNFKFERVSGSMERVSVSGLKLGTSLFVRRQETWSQDPSHLET